MAMISKDNNQSNFYSEDSLLNKYTDLFNNDTLSLIEYRRYLNRLIRFNNFEQFDVVLSNYEELLNSDNLWEQDQNYKFVTSLKLAYYLKKEDLFEAAEYAAVLLKPDVVSFEKSRWEDLYAMIQLSSYQIAFGLESLAKQILFPTIVKVIEEFNSSLDFKLLMIEAYNVMAKYYYAIGDIKMAEESETEAYMTDTAFAHGFDLGY